MRVFIFFICLITSINSIHAQEKYDMLLTKEFKIINAKIHLLGDERIQYTLPNQKRINEISTDKLIKVQLADGTERVYNLEKKAKANSENVADADNSSQKEIEYPLFKEDLVAIIPFGFYDVKTGETIGKNGLQVQSYIEKRIKSKAPLQNILNSRETNARLQNAKVDYTKLENYSPQELSKITGAGTIITGRVSLDFNEVTRGPNVTIVNPAFNNNNGPTFTRQHTNGNVTITETFSPDIYNFSNSSSAWNQQGSNSNVSYKTSTEMTIYKNGKSIYDELRNPLLGRSDHNAWQGNINWLLKKSPILR